MRTITGEQGSEPSAGDEIPASERVENFLACVETGQRRTTHWRLAFGAVGLLVAAVAYLTSTGLVRADPAGVAASAGTAVGGLVVRHP